jgi:hypothetical protein
MFRFDVAIFRFDVAIFRFDFSMFRFVVTIFRSVLGIFRSVLPIFQKKIIIHCQGKTHYSIAKGIMNVNLVKLIRKKHVCLIKTNPLYLNIWIITF